jgi:hypothetical protein
VVGSRVVGPHRANRHVGRRGLLHGKTILGGDPPRLVLGEQLGTWCVISRLLPGVILHDEARLPFLEGPPGVSTARALPTGLQQECTDTYLQPPQLITNILRKKIANLRGRYEIASVTVGRPY